MRQRIRASPVVQADETGWREAGQKGYVWFAGTPTGERYFEYHHRRAGAVIDTLLGEDFAGVLVSDFYAAYNDTPGGRHQRCWAHLLRDLHALKADHATSLEVVVWAKAVKEVYLLAKAWLAQGRKPERAYGELVLLVRALGEQFAQTKGHPCQGLAKRLLWHQDEVFVFVRQPGAFLPTIIWPSAACVRWWAVARSVGAVAAQWAARPRGRSPVCFRPGSPRAAIPCSHVGNFCKVLSPNSEQLRILIALTTYW